MRDGRDNWSAPDEQARRDIDAEIAAHLAARIDYLVARGMSRAAAVIEARRRFGDVDRGRAALLAQARARRRRQSLRDYLDLLAQDLRYVARSLTRSPAFSAGVIATLALGFGVNTAVFRVTDQVLLRPPPGVSNPWSLRKVEAAISVDGGAAQRITSFSYGDAERMLASQAFAASAMYTPPRLQRDGHGRDVGVSFIDSRYFPALGVNMSAGRWFDTREGEPGTGPGVAIVSAQYWQRAHGGVPLGEHGAISIAGREYRVVGVTARHFTGIDLDPVDVWVPLGDADLGRGSINGVHIPWYRSDMLRALRVVGRLGPAVEDVARARLTSALTAADAQYERPRRAATTLPIVPVGDVARSGEIRRLLLQLTVAAAVVLFIACANVMNLLLARGLRRVREISIRVAVGASRARVARLLLLEILVLAAGGSAAAALCGYWMSDALRRLVFPESRWSADLFDLRALLFGSLVAVGGGVVAGAAPALQSTRDVVVRALKEGVMPSATAARTRAALIVGQTALTLALLAACGLLVSSLMRLMRVDLGFSPSGLLTLTDGPTPVAEDQFTAAAVRLADAPGVRGVALTTIAPFGAVARMDITVPGSSYAPASDWDLPQFSAVSENFFTVMGMRLHGGRMFSAADTIGAEPVAIVNESMAQRYWPSATPFESCIIAPPNPCARIVGIVSAVRDAPAGADAALRFYLPLQQSSLKAAALVIRAQPEGLPTVVAALRAVVQGRQPRIEIVADRIDRALRPWTTATALFVLVAVVALALSCVGIYSVVSYLVAERQYEMGVRLALGATRTDVVLLVLNNGLRLVVLGAAFGVLAAAALARTLRALLFEVGAVEPAIYAAAALFLMTCAAVAMLPAAWRASRSDPVLALRAD